MPALPAHHVLIDCSDRSNPPKVCSDQNIQSYQRCSDSSDCSDHFGRKGKVRGQGLAQTIGALTRPLSQHWSEQSEHHMYTTKKGRCQRVLAGCYVPTAWSEHVGTVGTNDGSLRVCGSLF
jgi:hypothetical protein